MSYVVEATYAKMEEPTTNKWTSDRQKVSVKRRVKKINTKKRRDYILT